MLTERTSRLQLNYSCRKSWCAKQVSNWSFYFCKCVCS